VIGWLSGRVLHHVRNGAVVLDVRGVGYEVQLADAALPALGEDLEIFVYTVVREDAIQLFGFRTHEDRECFELLIATPGVGPQTALGALRTMSVDELGLAIEHEDTKKIATIAGIGPKTASRIVLELKGKISFQSAWQPPVSDASINAVVEDALRALGYNGHEVREALRVVTLPEDESAALRTALQVLRRP